MPSCKLRMNVVTTGTDAGLAEGVGLGFNEFRYAVVAGLGASKLANVEAETDPPPEENETAVGVGVGATGFVVQVTETVVISLAETVPDPLEIEHVCPEGCVRTATSYEPPL